MKNGFDIKYKKPIRNYPLRSDNHFNFLLILIFTFFSKAIQIKSVRKLYNMDSKIDLVFEGSIIHNIINEGYKQYLSEVYINNISTPLRFTNNLLLGSNKNNITLIFNQQLNTCSNMFANCNGMIEIDLSEFNFSEVKSMDSMFSNCINLKKINFGNIDTSSVENMRNIFYECSNLTSLDVSKFDTSSVTNIDSMFFGCSSIKSLNVSNFNILNNIKNIY